MKGGWLLFPTTKSGFPSLLFDERNGQVCSVIFVDKSRKRSIIGPAIINSKEILGIEKTGKQYVEYKNTNINSTGGFRPTNYKRIKAFESILENMPKGRRHKTYNMIILNYLMLGKDDDFIINALMEIESRLKTGYIKSKAHAINIFNSTKRWYEKSENKDSLGQIWFRNTTILFYLGLSRDDIKDLYECDTLMTYSKYEQKEINKEKKQKILNSVLKFYMHLWEISIKTCKRLHFIKKYIK